MNGRNGNGADGEHGARYARFVNRSVGGWQMAAEAAFVALVSLAMVAAAACFD